MEKATTSGCTVSWARRSASLFLTPIRWPTVPQASDSASVMRVSGSTTASHAGAASASSRSSSPPSSASRARMPGTTTSGVTRGNGGGAVPSRSGFPEASLTVADSHRHAVGGGDAVVLAAAQVPWWRSGVVYQIYPRSFLDTDGDGIGDLEGIRRHLDHLVWLGVDALWLSPIFRSPMADFGYDVSDYRDVDPLFGSLGDLDPLVAPAPAPRPPAALPL